MQYNFLIITLVLSSLLSGCRTGIYHFTSIDFDGFASFVNAYHKDQSNQLEEEKYLFEIMHLDQYRFVYVSQGITRRDDGSFFSLGRMVLKHT